VSRELYELFDSLNGSAIDNLLEQRTPESLYLEFKTTKAEPDRKRVASMLSGFANSAGGIIVWGIATERHPDSGRDVASERKPIPDVERFVTRLEQFTRFALSPSLAGIEHRIVSADSTGSGFAATYVPESSVGPHMALEGNESYFKRSEGEFYRMEHFDVADMFGARQRPALRLVCQPPMKAMSGYDDRAGDGYKGVQFAVSLMNAGRASAIAPYVRFEVSEPFSVTPSGASSREFGSSLRMFTEDGAPRSISMIGSPEFIVHPEVSVQIATVTARFLDKERIPGCAITFSAAAMNSPLEKGTIALEPIKISVVLERTVQGR
jgi:hypothetical protein